MKLAINVQESQKASSQNNSEENIEHDRGMYRERYISKIKTENDW